MRFAAAYVPLIALVAGCGSESDRAGVSEVLPPALTEAARSALLDDLTGAEARWEASGSSDYRMVIEVWNAGRTENWEVRVQDGMLMSNPEHVGALASPLSEDDPRPFMAWWFGQAREAIEQAHAVEIRLDSEVGYPEYLYVDQATGVLDDEVRYTVREFVTGVGP